MSQGSSSGCAGSVAADLRSTLERLTAIDRLRSCVSAASDRALLRRSIITCLVVGTILTVMNQGDRLLRGEFDAATGWKIGLTFLVPFVVATISGVAVISSRDDSNGR